jgi:hypothetical protein
MRYMVKEEEIVETASATNWLGAKVPTQIRQTVEDIAAREDRSLSYVTLRLVEIGLANLPKRGGKLTLPKPQEVRV